MNTNICTIYLDEELELEQNNAQVTLLNTANHTPSINEASIVHIYSTKTLTVLNLCTQTNMSCLLQGHTTTIKSLDTLDLINYPETL
jgi:hypothetical protein